VRYRALEEDPFATLGGLCFELLKAFIRVLPELLGALLNHLRVRSRGRGHEIDWRQQARRLQYVNDMHLGVAPLRGKLEGAFERQISRLRVVHTDDDYVRFRFLHDGTPAVDTGLAAY
jgi:hypothetical protein